jgi:hypothetical protein
MVQEGKRSITVSTDTFELLKNGKPDGVTWDYYLKQLRNNSEVKF